MAARPRRCSRCVLGNGIGVKLDDGVSADELFAPAYGSFLVELAARAELPAASDAVGVDVLGETTEAYAFVACGEDAGHGGTPGSVGSQAGAGIPL